MKNIFLTSSLGSNIKKDGEIIPCIIDNSNKMIDVLKSSLSTKEKLVVFVSNPNDFERNDLFHRINESSFKMSGFNFSEIVTIDNRNISDIKELIHGASLIILGGGHTPTQNKWFKEINLKNILKEYNGTILGISAGAINCSNIIYSCPELEGEAIDPNYNRWKDGLGLTDIKVLPHFDKRKTKIIDGLKVIEDIVIPDSYKHPIYALNDGSFIKIIGKTITVYGDCSRIYNGIITKICENGNTENI